MNSYEETNEARATATDETDAANGAEDCKEQGLNVKVGAVTVRSEMVDACGCRLERTEKGLAMIDCPLHAAAPDLLSALQSLFVHCAMIHKYGGESDNTKQADAAVKAARAAIARATK